jgi:F-type H+-transporting ATPase subunit gamma
MSAQSVRFLKRKIRAVQNIQKIARAMQLVSAAKWKRFNDRLVHFLHFWNKYKGIVEHLASYGKFTDYVSCFFESSKQKQRSQELIVVIASEKGLCGSYNSNIFRFLNKFVQGRKDFQCFAIGKKAIEFCSRNKFPLKFVESQFLGDVSFKRLTGICEKVKNAYLNEGYRVTVVYTHFVNTMVYRVTTDRFLPVNFGSLEKMQESDKISVDEKLWIYEPEPKEILDVVFDNYLLYKLLYYFYESLTSEHASRMIAMKNATENAEDLLLELTIVYNKARQSMITKELMDIVGTAEALK